MTENLTYLYVLKLGESTRLERVYLRLTLNAKTLQTVVNGKRWEARFGDEG